MSKFSLLLNRYKIALHELEKSDYKCNATHGFVGRLLPHLEQAEVAELLEEVKSAGTKTVIGPPVLVRGAEQLFSLHCVEGAHTTIAWKGVYRRKESYAHTGRPSYSFVHQEYEWRERVSTFAEVTWGANLIWDKSCCYYGIRLLNPTESGQEWGTTVGLDRPYATVLDNEAEDYPIVSVLEQAIIVIATDVWEIHELTGSSGNDCTDAFCGKCGGGIDMERCSFCQTEFTSASPMLRSSCKFPVPLRVLTEMNWKTTIDVRQAIYSYYSTWGNARVDPDLLTTINNSPRERVIQIEGGSQ